MSRSWVGSLVALVGVYAVTNCVYRSSPGYVQMCDSCYSLVVSHNVLNRGTPLLAGCVPESLAAREKLPGFRPETAMPYQWMIDVVPPNDVAYGYPLGSSLLSLPLVAAHAARDHLTPLGPDGLYDPQAEAVMQRRMGANLAALVVVLVRRAGPAVSSGGLGARRGRLLRVRLAGVEHAVAVAVVARAGWSCCWRRSWSCWPSWTRAGPTPRRGAGGRLTAWHSGRWRSGCT